MGIYTYCDRPLCLIVFSTCLCRRRQFPRHANPALQGGLWTSDHVPAPVLMGCFELHWGSMFYVRLFVALCLMEKKKKKLFKQGGNFFFPLCFNFLQPFKSPTPVNMENLPVNNGNGQSYGYTLYETTITSGGLLKSGDNVRDRALVSPHCTCWHRLTYSDLTLPVWMRCPIIN